MSDINKSKYFENNIVGHIINQLSHFYKSQIIENFAHKKAWADFCLSENNENKEKVSKQLLEAHMVWLTQKWDALLEISPNDQLPELKNEIYRLVEKSFEIIWWSTGKWIKTDHFNDENFKQLIVVKKKDDDNMILSGYRYSLLKDCVDEKWNLNTPMWSFFDFDKSVIYELSKNNAIELGTAWVNKEIGRAAIYGLHGIWDWLVYLYDRYQNKYFLGKMTIPSEDCIESYSKESRDFSINYLKKYYSSWEFSKLVFPSSKLEYCYPELDLDKYGMNWNFLLDEKQLREILISLDPKNKSWLFPNMFPIYLNRINMLDYIWTVKNWNVCESGIIVDRDQIKQDIISERKEVIDKWKYKFGDQKIKYGEYLSKFQ